MDANRHKTQQKKKCWASNQLWQSSHQHVGLHGILETLASNAGSRTVDMEPPGALSESEHMKRRLPHSESRLPWFPPVFPPPAGSGPSSCSSIHPSMTPISPLIRSPLTLPPLISSSL